MFHQILTLIAQLTNTLLKVCPKGLPIIGFGLQGLTYSFIQIHLIGLSDLKAKFNDLLKLV